MRLSLHLLLALCLAVAAAGASVAEEKISRTDRAKIRKTRESMRSLHEDLRVFMQRGGAYPKALKELVDGKYRENIPQDGWSRDFTYAIDDESGFRLTSWGADGKQGGGNADRDIVWTSQGEVIEYDADEAAKRAAALELARQQARIALARARMAVCGREVVAHRRSKSAWPKTLAEVRRTGTSAEDVAVNACFTSPWGHEFELRVLPGDNIAIVCWGADGKEGGEGPDGDFVVSEHEVRELYAEAERREWWGRSSTDWNLENLGQSVAEYRQRHGVLPADLSDLLKGPPNEAILRRLPRDRFNRDYVYLVIGEEYFLVSLGKDAREGGVEDDADTLWPVPGELNLELVEEGPSPFRPEAKGLLPDVAEEQMKEVVDRIGEHKAETGAWPEKLDDVAGRFPQNTVPLDPWGKAFVYEPLKDATGAVTGFALKSLGSDGAEGGNGEAADMSIDQDGTVTRAAAAEEVPDAPPVRREEK